MIELHRVGKSFDVDDRLIKLERVRRIIIRSRRVAARLGRVGADVPAAIDPAVNLDVGVAHELADPGVGDRDHQRAIDRIGPGGANIDRAAIRPLGERHRRGRLRRGRPNGVGTPPRRRRRIGRRHALAPFELVIAEKADRRIVAKTGVGQL